jgi:hypothetical protein
MRERPRVGEQPPQLDESGVATPDAERPVREVKPGPRDRGDEQEAGGDGIERLRPERPRGQIDDEAEGEDEAAARRQWLARFRWWMPGP